MPDAQQEQEKPTEGNRCPSVRGDRRSLATDVDAQQEHTVLSQPLPGLRGEFHSYLEPLFLDVLKLCCPPACGLHMPRAQHNKSTRDYTDDVLVLCSHMCVIAFVYACLCACVRRRQKEKH